MSHGTSVSLHRFEKLTEPQAPEMIHVVATLRVDPACREEFLRMFADLTPLVHAEEGCIEYTSTIDLTTSIDAQQPVGDDAVVVIEKWESIAALEAHLGAPHMAEFFNKTSEMRTGLELRVLKTAP